MTSEYAKNEVELAISIITGEDGFGELINRNDPILLLGISGENNGSISEEELKSELEEVAKSSNGLTSVQILESSI